MSTKKKEEKIQSWIQRRMDIRIDNRDFRWIKTKNDGNGLWIVNFVVEGKIG